MKRGHGVADSFVIDLPSKGEMKGFMRAIDAEASFIESSMEYLDMRVCHALAEGAGLGNAPNCQLLNVAEILGRDQWKGVAINPALEMEQLRAILASSTPHILEKKSFARVLEESGEWLGRYQFTDSWVEDDNDLDKVVSRSMKKGGRSKDDKWNAIEAILVQILEKKRDIWVERLVLCALWLKSAKKPPLPWHKMYMVAEVLSDKKTPLQEIPLMITIAILSLTAYIGRSGR